MNTFHTTVIRFLSNINYQEQPMKMQQTLKTKNAFPRDFVSYALYRSMSLIFLNKTSL